MSSTEYHVNRKELQFVVMEVLEAGKLCGFEDFSEFDEDLFSMTINEAKSNFRLITPIQYLLREVHRVQLIL